MLLRSAVPDILQMLYSTTNVLRGKSWISYLSVDQRGNEGTYSISICWASIDDILYLKAMGFQSGFNGATKASTTHCRELGGGGGNEDITDTEELDLQDEWLPRIRDFDFSGIK